MSLKDIKINGYYGDEIKIDNATHITIEHDRAITNNAGYENSDCDTVDIVIHCSDMPKRFKGKKGFENYLPNRKFIRLTVKGWKDKLLFVEDIKFNDFNLEGVESE
tara:strand:- start:64 stop:381 length:318 start_codon:yes stop_codon:yes gene_type:complete